MAASSWSYLNSSKQHFSGKYSLVCAPPSDYESNFATPIRRRCVATSESFYCPAWSGHLIGDILDQDSLLNHFDSAMEHESPDPTIR